MRKAGQSPAVRRQPGDAMRNPQSGPQQTTRNPQLPAGNRNFSCKEWCPPVENPSVENPSCPEPPSDLYPARKNVSMTAITNIAAAHRTISPACPTSLISLRQKANSLCLFPTRYYTPKPPPPAEPHRAESVAHIAAPLFHKHRRGPITPPAHRQSRVFLFLATLSQ